MTLLPSFLRRALIPAALILLSITANAQTPAFPLTDKGLVISRPTQPPQPFTVSGQSGVLVGTQDGQFESWINPIKFISHLTIEANLKDYTVPIPVNPQSANIEVRPDHTTITYSHPGFTIRQIMFSPDGTQPPNSTTPRSGPVVLFQIDSIRPLDLTFRFTPEMRWMWPRRSDGIPGPDWIPDHPAIDPLVAEPPRPDGPGFYILGGDYPGLAGAITIPTATPGILAPYQERPQVHPLELHLHYDPQRDGNKYFPLLMTVATNKGADTIPALKKSLLDLEASLPEAYKAHAAQYAKLESDSTSIVTPDKSLNEAFQWGVVSIEQLKAREYTTGQTALVAGYFASGDSARPGFGWFFGRDSLYTLYAVNSYGDFALTRAELEFLIARQREDGKIMHEYSQTAADPSVDWKSFGYMYAAADATPLFLMAMRDYYRSSGDKAFLQAHKEAIEKAWAFETAASSDTDHDGIYDNSQGTGWVESWPARMPHQEVYLALLDEQASRAFADLEDAFSSQSSDPAKPKREALHDELSASYSAIRARDRAESIRKIIEQEYYDPAKGCYAFATNPTIDGKQEPNSPRDNSTTIYPAVAWWDYNKSINTSANQSNADAPSIPQPHRGMGGNNKSIPTSANQPNAHGTNKSPNEGPVTGHDSSRADNATKRDGALAPEASPLSHPATCLSNFASPELDTDWGTRDLANTSPFYDGLSYHQGSVWPLFTGWAALAEYRANQPLAGQQLLMQNADLTWAQDPGAVTELLSGDYFVPFGRSTSHQLWSSAMVITPTLRGLFGINVDAATNTITVNPHLPAEWNDARIQNLHLGDKLITVDFTREKGNLVIALRNNTPGNQPLQLRSDMPNARVTTHIAAYAVQISIPLPPIELVPPFDHALPTPGSRTEQLKILSTEYGPHNLTVKAAAQGDDEVILKLKRNQKVTATLSTPTNTGEGGKVTHAELSEMGPHDPREEFEPQYFRLHFPKGEGYQTLEFSLTW